MCCSDEDVNTEERLRALVEELEDRNKELEEDLALERERGACNNSCFQHTSK